MPIDPSIALSYRPPQLANPLDQYAQVAAIQQAQNQNRLADLVYGEKQRDLQAENALSKLLSGGAKDQDIMSGLAAQGFGNKALAYQKQLIEQQKIQSEIGKNTAEATSKQFDTVKAVHGLRGAVFGSIAKAPTYENAVAQIQQINQTLPANMRIDPNSVPQDPAQLKEWATSNFMSTIDAAKQLEDERVRQEGVLNRKSQEKIGAAHDATSRANNSATVAATVRGQDLTDKRERDINGQKPPTEFQSKSAGFAARADASDKIISELTGKYSPAAINSKVSVESVPLVGGALGAATNKMGLSEADQRAEQAQRDFINAVLRQESGAVIGASEFDNARKQYFPQPGDTAAVIEQKAANRRLAVQGLKNSAGGRGAAATSAAPSGWSIVEVK